MHYGSNIIHSHAPHRLPHWHWNTNALHREHLTGEFRGQSGRKSHNGTGSTDCHFHDVWSLSLGPELSIRESSYNRRPIQRIKNDGTPYRLTIAGTRFKTSKILAARCDSCSGRTMSGAYNCVLDKGFTGTTRSACSNLAAVSGQCICICSHDLTE